MEGEWMTRKSANWKTGKLNCKNTYKTIPSRVRARTHHRSFCFFAVTSVTRKLYFTGFQAIADTLWININNEVIRVGLVRGKRYRKVRFSSCVSLNPNRSLDCYCTTRNWKDNVLSSFIFLLVSCFLFVLDVARYAFELTTNHLLNNPMKSVQDLMTDLG